MTDLERLSRALCTAREQDGGPPWDWFDRKGKERITDEVSAILTELRKQSDGVNDAMADKCDGDKCRCGFMKEIWHAGIDAVLEGK